MNVMKIISLLGSEGFFLLAMPALYWCVSARLGLRLGLFLMVSVSVNSAFKLGLHQPRPTWLDPQLSAYHDETTFGMPSAHAQNSVVVWGVIAQYFGKGWVWAAAIILIILVVLSRLVVGAHFLADVISGLVIGVLVLWALNEWEKPLTRWLMKKNFGDQVLWALGASIVMILVPAVFILVWSKWTLPVEWIQNASQSQPTPADITPFSLSSSISSAGAFFGLALGGILLQLKGGFDVSGPWKQRLLRYLVGVVGVFALWYGLGLIFPRTETMLSYILRYLRYTLVGLWIIYLAPLVFYQLKLATPPAPAAPPSPVKLQNERRATTPRKR
jgi:membrane-associated phospholipid phosphatase